MAPPKLDHLTNQVMIFLISPKHDSNMAKSYLTSKLTEKYKMSHLIFIKLKRKVNGFYIQRTFNHIT